MSLVHTFRPPISKIYFNIILISTLISRNRSLDLRFSKQNYVYVSTLQTYSVKRRSEFEGTIFVQISRTKNVFKVRSCIHWPITALSRQTDSVYVSMSVSLGVSVLTSFNFRVRVLVHSTTNMAIKRWEMANYTFIWFNRYVPQCSLLSHLI
jgi:hypothetical protein